MRYKVWDSKNKKYLDDNTLYNMGIGPDGKLYEFECNSSSGGEAWLSKTHCPEHYEIYYKQVNRDS